MGVLFLMRSTAHPGHHCDSLLEWALGCHMPSAESWEPFLRSLAGQGGIRTNSRPPSAALGFPFWRTTLLTHDISCGVWQAPWLPRAMGVGRGGVDSGQPLPLPYHGHGRLLPSWALHGLLCAQEWDASPATAALNTLGKGWG